jgi:putative endonuclease
MWFVYALSSLAKNSIYVGLTHEVEERTTRHESGRERTTRPYRPFAVLLVECFATRPEARRREKYLKSGVGKEYLKELRRRKLNR